MTTDQLIVQAAQMILFGASVDDVRSNLREFSDSESDFYLIYTAGQLHAQATADDYKFARLAAGII